MKVDYGKCREVVICLNNHFQNNDAAVIEYPSNIPYQSDEYFLYMFYSCLLDYGMRSSLYHKNLSNTYLKYPNIFSPKEVLKMTENELSNIIVSNIHPRYPNVALKKWIALSNELIKYDSISNVLGQMKSFDELSLFIRSISGYGQKTGGLLIRIIYDSSICSFEDKIKAIPIDRHDIEISYLTGVIDSKKVNEKDIQLLSDSYVRVGEELNISASDIDKYLWEIGNSFCNKKNCLVCPLSNICKRRDL